MLSFNLLMRLQILSDLHLEFAPMKPEATDAEVVLLAGDIHVGYAGVEWAQNHFPDKPVLYVLGNHEFYQFSIPKLISSLKRETAGSNIHVLENDVFELNGYIFLGCTLWTDFRLFPGQEAAMLTAEDIISDYRLIRVAPEDRRLRARDTTRFHAESLRWLKAELPKHDPKRTIVFTHCAPSARSIPPYHAGSLLNAAFASNLDSLVEESGIPLWIHGHTHYNVDYKIGSTRVLSNQRGYPEQFSPGFNPSLVVEL